VLGSLAAYAQTDETGIDTTRVESDSTFQPYLEGDTTGDAEFNMPVNTPSSFTPRSGAYGGPTIEFTSLDPAKLDPDLSGDLVLYGGQGYLMINGWMLGGAGYGATLYDISPKYDEFSFAYGGFLTGYDFTIVKPFSFRVDLLIGGGSVKMIKNRPDLSLANGVTILERYRDEGFFMLRPGASFGFNPLPFFDLRLGANYVFPVGGKRVSDLKNVAFGLQLMFGIGG
jgi:hypothetical protein